MEKYTSLWIISDTLSSCLYKLLIKFVHKVFHTHREINLVPSPLETHNQRKIVWLIHGRKADRPQDSNLYGQNSDSLMSWEWAREVAYSLGSRMQEVLIWDKWEAATFHSTENRANSHWAGAPIRPTKKFTLDQSTSPRTQPVTLGQQLPQLPILPGQKRSSSQQRHVIDAEVCVLSGLQTASLELTKIDKQKQSPRLYPENLVLCASSQSLHHSPHTKHHSLQFVA